MAYLKKVRTDSVLGIDKDGFINRYQNPVYVMVEKSRGWTIWLDGCIPLINKITSLPDYKLLHWIAENLPWQDNTICLAKYFKTDIMAKKNISMAAVERSISILKNVEILKPANADSRTGVYKVNPFCIWRGDTSVMKKKQKEWLEEKRVFQLPEKEQEDLAAVELYKKVGH